MINPDFISDEEHERILKLIAQNERIAEKMRKIRGNAYQAVMYRTATINLMRAMRDLINAVREDRNVEFNLKWAEGIIRKYATAHDTVEREVWLKQNADLVKQLLDD